MFRKISIVILFVSVAVYYCVGCLSQQKAQIHPSTLNFDQFPLGKLSEYGFFKGKMLDLQPNDKILVYEPIAPLFTDYAFKRRFVWMPEGTSATFDVTQPDNSFEFPDKTILIKNFYYPADFSKPEAERTIIETRLLVKKNGKWEAYPYKWDDKQSDADYKITGGIYPVSWKDEKGQAHQIDYAMPNKNQCKSCHNQNDVFMPIGPKVKQLNNSITYTDGTTENQLKQWHKMGYLKGDLATAYQAQTLVSYSDTYTSLSDRARSYLDVNCGHCHSSKGPAATSGLRLNFEEQNPFHWGVLKSPVAAGIGAGDYKFDINPGNGKESIVTYRMNSIHPGIMMPEIGRVSIHTEGVALVEAWINSLKKTN